MDKIIFFSPKNMLRIRKKILFDSSSSVTSLCVVGMFLEKKDTYIRSSDLKGFFPSFKTLDLAADQTSAAMSIYASKIQKLPKSIKENRRPTFLAGRQKLTVAPRAL